MKPDIPFVPSSDERLATMMELANVKPGQKAVDLGCGDGRVLIALGKKGATCYGYEIDPTRVMISKRKVAAAGLESQIKVKEKSFWDVSLAEFDVITIYGIGSIMERLEEKLLAELKKGAKVISNFYSFPNWSPLIVKNDVYLYRKGWD